MGYVILAQLLLAAADTEGSITAPRISLPCLSPERQSTAAQNRANKTRKVPLGSSS